MSRYLLLIRGGVPDGASVEGSPEAEAENARWYAQTNEFRADGVLVADDALRPEDMVTVTLLEGQPVVARGPLADAAEPLTGFYLIDVPDFDTAVNRAAGLPNLVNGGSVEVRPVMEFDD